MKKTKYVVAKSLKATQDKTFSPIDIGKFKSHVLAPPLPDDILRIFNKKFVKLANSHDLAPIEFIELLAKLYQINVVQNLATGDVSPKYFVAGLTMLKLAISFANEISLANSILNARDNLIVLEERVKALMADLPFTYEELPASFLSLINAMSDLN